MNSPILGKIRNYAKYKYEKCIQPKDNGLMNIKSMEINTYKVIMAL